MSFAFGATDTAVTDKTATSELSAWIGGENPTEAELELWVKLNDPKVMKNYGALLRGETPAKLLRSKKQSELETEMHRINKKRDHEMSPRA